ncbi:MAG: ASPIC/UnbV domain-containing protein, partial [Acidobacteriota bacterium]
GGNGFASQSSRIVHVGLGDAATIDRVEVAWPSGRRQQVEKLAADRRYRWVEGEPGPRPSPHDAAIRRSPEPHVVPEPKPEPSLEHNP